MTGRLMTPYCFATQAVSALMADTGFALRLLKALTFPASADAPPPAPDAIGGLTVTAGDSPFDLDIRLWGDPDGREA